MASSRRSVAVIVLTIALAAAACSKKDTTGTHSTSPVTTASASGACKDALATHGLSGGVPITYQAAKEGGCADKITWNDSCDTTTGFIKLPLVRNIPCVAKQTGPNGGATSPGVTDKVIKIAYYQAPPDPSGDALLKSTGTYDTPEAVQQTAKDYAAIFNAVAELYGRKVEVVTLHGTGTSTDEAAARADALKAKDLGVFAVLGGPSQAKSFSQELAADHILCIGSCIVAQPQAYYKANSPYIWPIGPSPDQSADMNVEFVKNQLVGKNAEFAGDPAYVNKPRTFALLTYDTPDGQFASAWNHFESNLKAAVGSAYKGRVTYFLNVATVAQDGKEIARKLKALGASTVVFTGDPLEPVYFTKEATTQGYFPEWVLAGTVYADTTVFARNYDPQQWKHAFGESLIPPRIPREQTDSITLYKWGEGGKEPPAANSAAIQEGNMQLLFTGLQLAGPNLTPDSFRTGIFAAPVPPRDPTHLQATVTFGDHGFWPAGTDYSGGDDYNIVWWNPTGKGQDETGKPGTGIYMYVNNAARFRIGEMSTAPIGLFQAQGSVAYFTDNAGECNVCRPVPPALKYSGPQYPPPNLSGG